MEGVEFDIPELSGSDDFCESILSRLSTSTREDHQRLCAVIGTMSQELKDQNLPCSPISYFGAASSSLDRLLSSDPDPPAHIVESLTTILSLVLPRIPAAILRKKREFVTGLVLRVLTRRRSDNQANAGPVVSGLKCVEHLLIVRDTVNWSDFSQLYGVLLGFMVDSIPKVREQAQTCIREVLRSFQGTSALASACDGITSAFERYLLLAGGSNSNADVAERPKGGAQEVLYIMDTLKECLPLMTMKYTTAILKYYKTLLELRQPVVTRRVSDSLNMLCQHPTSDVSAEMLLDLLCSLAVSASTNETSFTARLLDVGMRKSFSLNRQSCVVKLPVIFTTLKDILEFEQEESIFAATEALKSLICNCIDENLIKQGVDQIMMHKNGESRMSGPTVIEKLCATIESLLDYHYHAICDMVFQVVSAMFDKLGQWSLYFMRGTLKNLEDMQRLPDEDFPYRKQLNECFGSAVGAMGPEAFLSVLPLKLEADELSQVNVWIFPILKQYTVGARLSFFTDTILSWIGHTRQKSQKLELEGRIIAARSTDALTYSLWSLLPSFCNYPLDTAESFKDLENALCNALLEESNVRGMICSALQILIQQNKRILEGKDDLPGTEFETARNLARARYSPQLAADNLDVIRASGHHFLTVMARILLESVIDDGGCLQATISEFASIADKAVVRRIFLKTMRKLLEVTQKAVLAENSGKSTDTMHIDDSSTAKSPSNDRARLFDLAVSLLPGLGDNEIGVLLSAVKPALQDGEGLIQKKAYKVLSVILQTSDKLLSSGIEELLQLMIEVLPLCHFSAKRHRLDCLYYLIVHVSKQNSYQKRDILGSFLTEIILALKEANKKTRNRAYEVLVQIAHACGDEEKGGNKEDLFHVFNMVAGGIAGESPHMVSAAVKGLARLAYEFSDLIATAYKLLPSTFLLLQRKNREIIKANLGFLKVLVAKSQSEGLHIHLGAMVEGLLKWQDDSKNHFKAKVKHILEMLVKKCGLEAVKSVMPEEHMKLITNIRKTKERRERNLAANSEENRSHLSRATTSRISRWNHTKIFSDFDDEETDDSDAEYIDTKTASGRQRKASSQLKSKASSIRSKKLPRSKKRLHEDLLDQLEDEPLDLLDSSKTRSALRSSDHLKRKQESDDEPEIDPDGRLIVREGGKTKKERPSDPNLDVRSEAGSNMSGNSRKTQKKRLKTSETGWAYTGSEYTNKKAGGDLKKKDKLEPYAYWPLDRKMMSRRPEHRAAARKGMTSVVKMTKKLEGRSASSALSMKLMKFKKIQKRGGKRKSK